jgi:hypothetical protein
MEFLNQILILFEGCFTAPCFRTFVSVILGMIIRTDNRGMASFVRALFLDPSEYNSFEYFFKSASYNLREINTAWIKALVKLAPFATYLGCLIFTMDGVKTAKEGRKMVGVKKLHQESENSSKGEFIHGHMFGGLGILAGGREKVFCIPTSLKLHDGLKSVLSWSDDFEHWRSETHIVQMIHQTFDAAKIIGKDAIVLADRYFPTVPAFKALDELNSSVSDFKVCLLSKMKISAKAYEDAPAKTGKRGRPAKKGKAVKLKDLFESKSADFTEDIAYLYGEHKEVRYFVTDLLWGQTYYKKLRFVLVEYDCKRSILVTTNLGLSGKAVLELYGYRFKIECTFRELKQVVCGFGYRFWNKSMPKLNRYKKKGDPDPLESITSEAERKNILKTIRAIEMFALCSCIALGSLQLCSLKYSKALDLKKIIFLRTYRGKFASEATMAEYLRGRFYCLLGKQSDLAIIRKIKSKQPRGSDFNSPKAA